MSKKTARKRRHGKVLGDVLERQPVMLEAEKIEHAPWNPREEIRPEDVADISESIKSVGLLERLVVIEHREKAGMYIVVAGNRRLVACRVAGLDPIPCDLIMCSTEHAKRATLIENLQRKDVDPILEAGLIEKLVDGGMTEDEIARETGRGNKWVWRRKQLQKLAEPWREYVNGGHRFTVDCLERIASYTEEIQKAAAEDFDVYVGVYGYEKGNLIAWKDIQREFTSRSRELKDATFPKSRCTNCPNNSANAPMLFDCVQQKNGKPCKWGTCLDAKCFEQKTADMIEVAKREAKDTGHEVKEVKHEYDVPEFCSMKDKPDEEHKILYVYSDYNGTKHCGWGKERVKSEGADDAAEQRKAERKIEKAKRKAREAIEEWLGTDKAKEAVERFVSDGEFPIPDGSNLTICEYLMITLLCNMFGKSFTIEVWLKDEAMKVLREAKKDGERWPNDLMTGKQLREWVADYCAQLSDSIHGDDEVGRFLELFGEDVYGCYPEETFEVYRGKNAAERDGDAAERDGDDAERGGE